MRYDGIVNPLYVDEKPGAEAAAAAESEVGGSPVSDEDVVGLVPLHKNRGNFRNLFRRLVSGLVTVLLVLAVIVLFQLAALYAYRYLHPESAPIDASILARRALGAEARADVVERAMPRAELFEAVLSEYATRYGEMGERVERALASWWSAASMRARVLATPASEAAGVADVVAQFLAFQRKFNRSFFEDFERRLENFVDNAAHIRELNALNAQANTTFGVNDFADWSEAEFKQMLMPADARQKLRAARAGTGGRGASFVREMNPIFRDALTDDYPEHFDWREKGVVTPVKNQGKCGSCWAFATAATVESAYAVAHGQLRSLSEQELLDCNLANNACNGGDVDKAFRFVHEHGLMAEDAYPYVAQRQNTCRLDAGDSTTKIDVAYFINPDERSIVDWLVNFGPVNIGIAVPPDMKPYTGGVYRPSDYDCKFRVLGLHALLIVGYGTSEDGEKYWIVKNSWGDTWGVEHGYVYFARGVNACGIEDEPIGLLA